MDKLLIFFLLWKTLGCIDTVSHLLIIHCFDLRRSHAWNFDPVKKRRVKDTRMSGETISLSRRPNVRFKGIKKTYGAKFLLAMHPGFNLKVQKDLKSFNNNPLQKSQHIRAMRIIHPIRNHLRFWKRRKLFHNVMSTQSFSRTCLWLLLPAHTDDLTQNTDL